MFILEQNVIHGASLLEYLLTVAAIDRENLS